jgi:hypothetical protein
LGENNSRIGFIHYLTGLIYLVLKNVSIVKFVTQENLFQKTESHIKHSRKIYGKIQGHWNQYDTLSFSFFSLYCCAVEGTLWHLPKFLQCFKCIILEFTPSTTTSSPYPIPAIVLTGTILHFLTCVRLFCTVFTHLPAFPNTSFMALVPFTRRQTRTCMEHTRIFLLHSLDP